MGQSNEPLTIYLQQSNGFNGDLPYNSPQGIKLKYYVQSSTRKSLPGWGRRVQSRPGGGRGLTRWT